MSQAHGGALARMGAIDHVDRALGAHRASGFAFRCVGGVIAHLRDEIVLATGGLQVDAGQLRSQPGGRPRSLVHRGHLSLQDHHRAILISTGPLLGGEGSAPFFGVFGVLGGTPNVFAQGHLVSPELSIFGHQEGEIALVVLLVKDSLLLGHRLLNCVVDHVVVPYVLFGTVEGLMGALLRVKSFVLVAAEDVLIDHAQGLFAPANLVEVRVELVFVRVAIQVLLIEVDDHEVEVLVLLRDVVAHELVLGSKGLHQPFVALPVTNRHPTQNKNTHDQ